MCMLDCLLVSAICFYMYKAKNMNGRRNIFTDTFHTTWPSVFLLVPKLIFKHGLHAFLYISLPAHDGSGKSVKANNTLQWAVHFY